MICYEDTVIKRRLCNRSSPQPPLIPNTTHLVREVWTDDELLKSSWNYQKLIISLYGNPNTEFPQDDAIILSAKFGKYNYIPHTHTMVYFKEYSNTFSVIPNLLDVA